MKMTKFDHMISYLSSKGVELIVKTEYKDGVPCGKRLISKLTVTKSDQFFRVNGKVVSKNMAHALMGMAAQ
jgi:hypothetical protein